jgi:hypothetical protein
MNEFSEDIPNEHHGTDRAEIISGKQKCEYEDPSIMNPNKKSREIFGAN